MNNVVNDKKKITTHVSFTLTCIDKNKNLNNISRKSSWLFQNKFPL